MGLHFNMAAMEWLADHRIAWLTPIMQAASFMGEVHGYVLIGTLVYVAFDKGLAIRLMLLVTLTMCFNHVIKLFIGNPRPFFREGSYQSKWAVSPSNAVDIAHEYSTPSGHAMASGSFYTYLFGSTRNRMLKSIAIMAIVVIGASRPYLGVHYIEDILLGWPIGICVGLFALRYGGQISRRWSEIAFAYRVIIAVVCSFALWTFTMAVNRGPLGSEPRAFLGYAGTVTGIIIAHPLELRFVDFEPRSGTVFGKGVRYLIAVVIALLTLEGLGELFAKMSPDYSSTGYVLQYVRYIALSIVSLFCVPWLLVRCRLAMTASQVRSR